MRDDGTDPMDAPASNEDLEATGSMPDEDRPAMGQHQLPGAAETVQAGKEGTASSGGAPGSPGGEESELEARRRLIQELDRLIERVKATTPGYEPPPFSPRGLIELIERNLEQIAPSLRLGILERLRSTISGDLLDIDTWKGVWYMLNYTLQYQADILKRRISGNYVTDPWGFDQEFVDIVEPFVRFLYRTYWRVQVSGLENVPTAGKALLVANHSGQLPWDGLMIGEAMLADHPSQRLVRNLYADWFTTLPLISAVLTRLGQALANEENGIRLLQQDELVGIFPEGYKGIGKLFSERYRLARFGRGGFVRMALKTQAPIIPVAVVGAEETYISLYKSETIARVIGFPYFPISLTWPWLGLLGLVPMPTKWYIDFGEPIATDGYEPGSEDNLMLVSQLTDQVRNIIQQMIYQRLENRKSVFLG